jgi:hypothetical protein
MFVSYNCSKESREIVRNLLGTGLSDYEIARRSGVSRGTVQRWRKRGIPAEPLPELPPAIYPATWTTRERDTYSYLLGQYLGDGHITTNARTFTLTVTCDGKYPGIIDSVAAAIAEFSPRPPSIRPVKNSGAIRVAATWKAWPLFFPQHGPGSKLDRKIELVDWQEEIVDEHPKAFLRGLIHSDGSRCLNTFQMMLKDGPKEYSYPRYFFTNYSADIQAIFCRTCDRLGIRWSRSNWRNISISHRDSVALLDEFVGAKG